MPATPKMVGREFVQKYYIVMNKSPESLYCFYTDTASFVHDEIDPDQRRTITADGKTAIRDAMLARLPKYNEAKTQILHVETSETIGDCLIVQAVGNISYNGSPMRPFSQTIILTQKSPFHYFVQNDIFRFCDFELDDNQNGADDLNVESEAMEPDSEQEQLNQSDWGTQCEDIEPFEERALVKQTMGPRGDEEIFNGAPVNEVKLDTSDSGLSSDAEKAIVDIQSLNLKNILQEKRSITKGSVMLRSTSTSPTFVEDTLPAVEQQQRQPIETTTATTTTTADVQIPQNKNTLFRDSCILTIGNTVNPNIEFDDAKCDEDANKLEPNESVDENSSSCSINGASGNVSGSSSASTKGNGKDRNRKRKEKRKAKHDNTIEKSSNECNDANNQKEKTESQTDNNNDHRPAVTNQSTQCSPEIAADKSNKAEPKTETDALEQETPKPAAKISYADLAKSGTDEWVDEMANRRGSVADKRATLPRRNSRTGDRPTGPSGGDRPSGKCWQILLRNFPYSSMNSLTILFEFLSLCTSDGYSRFSPKNDLLQVFVGNIPHSASEHDIRRIFSRFGHLVRCRFNSNPRKEWLPQYAFITYENIQSVRQCLMKKVI